MSSMPTKVQIAEYWIERQVFTELCWGQPGCFACGYPGGAEHCTLPEVGWKRASLDRAHLIPRRSKGPDEASNVILLCPRCHRDAPMVGISQQPMINWVNRRESHLDFLMRRMTEECAAIDPKLLGSLAGHKSLDVHSRLKAALKAMDSFPHPGGDFSSTIAAALKNIRDFSVSV